MTNWDPEAFTRGLIADMREHGGKVTSGPMAGRPLLVLTTTGRKTGQPRTVIVTFTRDGDAYVVAGSKSGAPTDPHWFHNLIANPIVQVEGDGKRFQGRAVVAEGADRDQLWERHVAERPEFAEYPEKSGRIIPMARMTPID
ncbi:MAG: nitroreductase/quinone reductase family protein [Chloroflexota bacterium]